MCISAKPPEHVGAFLSPLMVFGSLRSSPAGAAAMQEGKGVSDCEDRD